MYNSNTWKFVTPSYLNSQKFKGLKTPTQIKNFAIKNDVLCGWWKNTGSKGKHFLVEFSSFKKAYRNQGWNARTTTATKWNARKNTTWNTRKNNAWNTRKATNRWPNQNTARRNNTNWKSRYTARRRAA
ncbi:MAG TPA: hypothetical protein VMS93_10435 [Candidatus Saccharimonadales bacterium]|nr:hypothetical protein [Candidatus Saccharimonadales bacterium]